MYLHYVFDLWVLHWRKHRATGEVIVVRYADDSVLGFQYRSDAERFLRDWRDRLQQFGLELHPDKTRLIEFGRFAVASRKQRGEGKPKTFDFLGFTHICGQSRKNGKFLVLPKTMRLPLPKSRFLVHNVEINIRVATVRLERLGNSYARDPRSPSCAPCPGHPANQTYQIEEARHLTKEASEASDLQMPEGRSVNVNAPEPAKEALHPSEQDCRLIVDSIPGHVVTLTAQGDIEFVNRQWLHYLGKTLDEL